MKFTIICLVGLLVTIESIGQNTNLIYEKILKIDSIVVYNDCSSGEGMIVSYRGLDYFFADKIGSYLAEGSDLSLFKNYATFNTTDGRLSINQNYFPKYSDDRERLHWAATFGINANIKEGYASVFSGKKFNSDLGVTAKYTRFWSGTVKFGECKQKTEVLAEKKFTPTKQKMMMNEERAMIAERLRVEMEIEALDFECSINGLQPNLILDQVLADVKEKLRKKFYSDLEKTYLKKYATEEAKALSKDSMFNKITTHWTSVYAFIPLTTKKYLVAPSFAENFSDQHIYPFELSVTHTCITESRRWGRFFTKVGGTLVLNNGIKTDQFDKVDINDYRDLGGGDTIKLAQLKTDEAYIGDYKQFLTPALQLQFVWFPPKCNIGLSLYAEKFFGDFNSFNGKVGIPIKLSDKESNPLVTFELQARFTDISNDIQPNKTFADKASYGISIGLPFSSILN